MQWETDQQWWAFRLNEDASYEVIVVAVQVVQVVGVQEVVVAVLVPLVTCVRIFELGVCAGGRGGRYWRSRAAARDGGRVLVATNTKKAPIPKTWTQPGWSAPARTRPPRRRWWRCWKGRRSRQKTAASALCGISRRRTREGGRAGVEAEERRATGRGVMVQEEQVATSTNSSKPQYATLGTPPS